jgi:hypothetical protein
VQLYSRGYDREGFRVRWRRKEVATSCGVASRLRFGLRSGTCNQVANCIVEELSLFMLVQHKIKSVPHARGDEPPEGGGGSL